MKDSSVEHVLEIFFSYQGSLVPVNKSHITDPVCYTLSYVYAIMPVASNTHHCFLLLFRYSADFKRINKNYSQANSVHAQGFLTKKQKLSS